MHPIERLRYVARAAGEGPALLAREAAGALASFAGDPPGLVTACRRLVDRQPASGPVWWLAARVLTAGDASAAAWQAVELLDDDGTAAALASALPQDALVTVIGWPEQAGDALRRRGDCRVLVVDACDDGEPFVHWLARASVEAELVDPEGAGAAAAASDVVLLEATALGCGGFVGAAGSRAAAAVGRHARATVWVVAGVGRVLPDRMWLALAGRIDDGEPWHAPDEVVPLDLVDAVVGPTGLEQLGDALCRADCPVAPELLRGPA